MPKPTPMGGQGPKVARPARPQDGADAAEYERPGPAPARHSPSRAEPAADKADRADKTAKDDPDDDLDGPGRSGVTTSTSTGRSPTAERGPEDAGASDKGAPEDGADPDDLDSGDAMRSHVGAGTRVATLGATDAVATDVEVVKVAEGETGDGPVDADAQIGVVTPGAGTAHGGVVLGGVQVDAEVDVGGVHVQGGVTVVNAIDPTVTGPVANVGGVGVGGDLQVEVDDGALPHADAPALSTIVGDFGTGSGPAPPPGPGGDGEVTAATSLIATNFGGGAGAPPPPPPAPPDAGGVPSPGEVADAAEDAANEAADAASETAGEVQETGEDAANDVQDALDDFF